MVASALPYKQNKMFKIQPTEAKPMLKAILLAILNYLVVQKDFEKQIKKRKLK